MRLAMEKLIIGLLVLFVSIVVIALGLGIYFSIEAGKQPTFTLRKDQWECVESTSHYTTTNVVVGKVFIPQTSRVTECVNYKRR